jgi:hypothetical protein
MADGQSFTAEEVKRWVEASCAAQGVPVKVSDALVVRRIGMLLGAGSDAVGRADAGRAQAAPAASTPRADRPARTAGDLQSPDRPNALPVETAGTQHAGSDDGVVEHGPDDGGLPVEIE